MQTCQMETDWKIYQLEVETNATGASHANTKELKDKSPDNSQRPRLLHT